MTNNDEKQTLAHRSGAAASFFIFWVYVLSLLTMGD
jgi:hypothetical protein